MDKYAGEMKRGGTRKDVWYRCKQGGEKMFGIRSGIKLWKNSKVVKEQNENERSEEKWWCSDGRL